VIADAITLSHVDLDTVVSILRLDQDYERVDCSMFPSQLERLVVDPLNTHSYHEVNKEKVGVEKCNAGY